MIVDNGGAADADETAGVLLRAAGHYYAIPGQALAAFLVPPARRAAVEAFLSGEDALSLGSGGGGTCRTSRRSHDLWLLFD